MNGMRYVLDRGAGITREKKGGGFRYRDPKGALIRDPAVLERIRRLAIPPAWTRVWICPRPDGHLQATGRDARGRKQYRYHPDWREKRDEDKFHRVVAFGRTLPRIRRAVARDLRRTELDRRKVLAAVVRLLETTHIRVGNEEYARTNHSFGLTTLRRRHAAVRGEVIHFHFQGKSGKQHEIDLPDRRLSRIVRRLQDLPGQELFHFLDAKGAPRRISSEDVNAYLHEIAGAEFSAKDFRTWSGTVEAAIALREFERCESPAQAKRNLLAVIARVAERLGNTPAICRRSYIHPMVLSSYLEGLTISGPALRHEAAVLRFLERRLKAG